MSNRSASATDPATAEVIRHYLASAATEMERTLVEVRLPLAKAASG